MKLCPICLHCYEDTETACARDRSVLLPSRHGSRLIADKYRLDKLIGRGGMGAVYAGVHVELERPAAIKLLLPDFVSDQQAAERFKREARAAARLNHPNVAGTYDYGTLAGGESYIVMELVEGQTLGERLRAAGALPFHEAATIARQVAHGIENAHRGGIVHRDLKPSNIILSRDHHDALLVKVLDFGIAKLKEHTTGALDPITKTGSLVGTPRYMSPEQCADHNVDARSDIYSLGVILYEMLAGHAPFEAPSAAALALKHIQEQPPPLRLSRPDTPGEIERLVMWALAKDPADRPQTAAEFAHALGAVVEPTHQLASTPPAAGGPPHGDKLRDTGQHTPHSTGAVPSTGPDTNRSGAPTGDEGSPDAPDDGQGHPPEDLAEPPAPPASEPEVLTRAATPPPQKVVGRSFIPVAVVGLLLCLAALAVVLIARRGDTSPPVASKPGARVSPAPDASRGGQPPPATQPSTEVAINPSTAPTGGSSTRAPEAERETLRSALDGWVAATNSRDIGGQLVYYAPQLDAFYTRRGVSREDVRAEKQSTFGQATRVNMSVSDPSIEVGGDGLTSVMRFRKQYLIEAGGQSRSGEVLQELRWARTSAGWRITSERDLQVLR